MMIFNKKNKNEETVNTNEIKKFMEKNVKKKKNRFKLFFILFLIIFIFVTFFYLFFLKTNADKIIELRKEIEIKNEIIKNNDDILKKKENELGYFYFKDFYYTTIDDKMSKILFYIWKYSKINNVDPFHILLIMSVESAFNPNARSNKDAYGLMQIHYVSWKGKYNIKSPEELYDEEFNIKLGCEIFRHYMDKMDDDFGRALFLYNTGNLRYLTNYANDYLNQVQNNKFFQPKEWTK